MANKISDDIFVTAFIENALSSEKKTMDELASHLGISRNHVYRLKNKLKDKIQEVWNESYKPKIQEAAVTGLIRELGIKGVTTDKLQMAFKLTGDLKDTGAGGTSPEGGGPVVINVGQMDKDELADYMDRKLHDIRNKNLNRGKEK